MTKLVEGTGSGPNGVLVGSVRFGMSGIDDIYQVDCTVVVEIIIGKVDIAFS